MSRDNISNVIARINKLRALSESNANANEAANAARAAAKLIDEHQLSEMDLVVRGEIQDEPIEESNNPLFESGRVMLWVSQLAMVLGNHYGCTGYIGTVQDFMKVYQNNPNARRDTYKAYKLVGRKSDIEVTRYMFTWLQPVIIELTKKNAYGQGMRFSQNYAYGVVQGIKAQLDLEHAQAVANAAATNKSQAMVLLDNRSKLSNDFMEKTVMGLRKAKTSLRRDNEAQEMGKEAGKAIKLKKGLPGGSTPNKLS